MNSKDEDDLKDIAVAGARKAAGEIVVKALSPAAEEIGKGLVTVAKAVNIGLAPLSVVVWGYDQICSYVEGAVTRKLKNVSAKDICPPPISVAGPAIEAMRFSAENENIKDLFAGLIATAMNSEKQENAHPAYTEIIKQLSSDEAVILKTIYLEGQYPEVVDMSYEVVDGNDEGEYLLGKAFEDYCEKLALNNPRLTSSYFDNFLRLRIFDIHKNSAPIIEETTDFFNEKKLTVDRSAYASVKVTSFGENFLVACVYAE